MATLEQGALTIRHMTRQDIDAALSLDRKFGKGPNSLSYKDMVTTDPGGPLDLSFVAEVAGTIVGFVIARLTYMMVPLTGICLLHSILIDPDYQMRGIGVRLLGELVSHCQEEGINTIRSLVEERNNELRRFVEKMGFRRSTVINYDKTFDS